MVLYGFPTRDERDTFEALIGATGVGPEARARDPLGAHAEHVAPLPRRRRPRRAGARARRRQAHRPALARRPEGAPRGPRPRPRPTPRGGPSHAARRGARRAHRARLLARRGARRCSASSATKTARSKTLLRDALRVLAGPDEAEPVRDRAASSPAGRSGRRRPKRRRCGRAGSTSSSASPRLREHLEIMLTASRQRGQAVDHVLFAGPPGLGKTTLAGIIATEMGARMQPTSGPALERAGDLAAILTNLDDGDVLFIDEIHRPAARGRRGPVSGDGGLPARHRDRQGPVGALDPPRPAPLHARRRDHAHRA